MGDVIRVVKSGDYSLLSNFHLKDKRLSWGAKGLLSTMLAFSGEYTIDELEDLSSNRIFGTDEFAELKQNGYLTWKQYDSDSKSGNPLFEYTIYEKPTIESSSSDPVAEIMHPEDMPSGSKEIEVDEEENQKLRERLAVDKLEEQYSKNFVQLIFYELCRRDEYFQKMMTAKTFEMVCATAMKHQIECRNNGIGRIPIFHLSVVINTAFDNIEKGFRKRSPKTKKEDIEKNLKKE